MKEKILNYLLLDADVYKRPLRKRYVLLLLCAGAGLVIITNYATQSGFGFLNNLYAIIMTLVLIFFCGIFAMVVYSWPAADFAASVGKASGKMGLSVKRLKVAKGFLFAVIYTGIISAFLRMLANQLFELNGEVIASVLISVAASFWAGAIMTRCITSVFEEAASRKITVFIAATAWYYIIIVQIMGFIIKSAYSIIL